MKGNSKFPASQLVRKLGKFWKCNLGLHSKPPNFPYFYELGKNEKSN